MIVIKVIFVLIVMYLFMVCPKLFNRKDCSMFKGYFYAHRGLYDNNSDCPENSLNAIRKAVENDLFAIAPNLELIYEIEDI